MIGHFSWSKKITPKLFHHPSSIIPICELHKPTLIRKLSWVSWSCLSKACCLWSHDKCSSLTCSSRLIGTSTNWVGEDVTVMHVQGVLSMAAWRISRSCLSTMCCPWLHAHYKPLLHAFILDRFLPFHIRLVWGCMTIHQNRVYTCKG